MVSVALAEPLRYRQGQQLQASAQQTDGGVALQAGFAAPTTESNTADNNNGRSEPAPEVNQNGPYLPKGWRPIGQLLVLPFAVRENVESTTTVESTSFNDQSTESNDETSTTPVVPAQRQLPTETSEPKFRKTAPYKKPTVKLVGELKVTTNEDSKQKSKENSKGNSAETSDSDNATTEQSDEAATTVDPKSENLETTSEPQSEAVDVETSNEDGQQSPNAQQPPQIPQTAFFVQLPDGSLQRIVYLAPQTPAQAAFVSQPANVPFQQLNQSPNYPFGFNPITNPKIVTFSSQYQAY